MRTLTERSEARPEVMQGVNDHDVTLIEAIMELCRHIDDASERIAAAQPNCASDRRGSPTSSATEGARPWIPAWLRISRPWTPGWAPPAARSNSTGGDLVERRPITSRAEWLEWRMADVTASDVGGVVRFIPTARPGCRCGPRSKA